MLNTRTSTYQNPISFFVKPLQKRESPSKKCANAYRFGFNGQERDDEVSGAGNTYTAEFWEYDSRLGRRFNLDPKPDPSISGYACFRNNPIAFTDIAGDSGEYYDTKGNLLHTSIDKLPNAVVVIPDKQLERFNNMKGVIDRNAKDPEKALNSDPVNKLFRSLGKAYMVDKYWGFFDSHSKDYTSDKTYTPKPGEPRFVDENSIGISDQGGVMNMVGNSNRVSPFNSSSMDGTNRMHTHPNEGRGTREGFAFDIGHGNPDNGDVNKTFQKDNGSGHYDIGVTGTQIRLYNQTGVRITINRNTVFGR